MTDPIPPKSWIAQLFCKHNWIYSGRRKVFEDSKSELPIYREDLWQCQICGKIKKLRI